jgi:hypothetical protein
MPSTKQTTASPIGIEIATKHHSFAHAAWTAKHKDASMPAG